MSKILKIVASLALLFAVFLGGATLGYWTGRDVSYRKLYIGEQEMGLRNMLSTAVALRRAHSTVYLNQMDSLILWQVGQLASQTRPDHGPVAMQLAKAYYDAFNLPVPPEIQSTLSSIPPMEKAEFERITELDVSEIVRKDLPNAK